MQFHKTIFDYLYTLFAAQRGNLFLWIPVMMGLAIGFYFTLDTEPPLLFGAMATLICIMSLILIWPMRHTSPLFHTTSTLLFLITVFCSAFTLSQIRTSSLDTVLLTKEYNPVDVVGKIKRIEPLERPDEMRLLLENITIDNLPQKQTPRYVRLKLRGYKSNEMLGIGDIISLTGGINPPSAPAYAGGFDFQRFAYFKQIGGFGFIYGKPEIIRKADTSDNGFLQSISAFKVSLLASISENLPPAEGGVTAALMTGEKGGIPSETLENLRNVGLAHLLSVSGLHVGLVTGTIFLLVRFILTCIPGFGLRYPLKKWSAGLSFLGACFYVLLVGMHIPAIRALLMTGIVLIAIIFDRYALSLRLVAIAAAVILAIFPEALMSASFQLSFAAVASLIYAYNLARPYVSILYKNSGYFRRFAIYFLGVIFTTIIASIATTPFTWYHFQQIPLLGLISNLVAVPLVSFIVMPLIVLAFVVMPVGLDVFIYPLIKPFITMIIDVSAHLVNMPGASLFPPAIPLSALTFFVCSFLSLVLLTSHLRLISCAFLILSVIEILSFKQPDIIISASGKLTAYKPKQEDLLYLSTKSRQRFEARVWRDTLGLKDKDTTKLANANNKILCDEMGCRWFVSDYNISFLKHENALQTECSWADVVIYEGYIDGLYKYKNEEKEGCKSLITAADTYRKGAHNLYFNDDIKVITDIDIRGNRPWVIKHAR